MKRAVLFTAYCNPLVPFSGFGYRTYAILQWLTDRFEVDLVFPGDESDLHRSFIPLKRFRTIRLVEQRYSGLRKLKACISPLPYFHTLWSTPELRSVILQLVRERNHDFIWTNTTVHMPILQDLPRAVPIIVDQLAAESCSWDSLIHADPRLHIRLFSRWNKYLDLRYEKRTYPLLAGVVCISPSDEAITNEMFPGPPTVSVPQGVDPSYYAPSESRKPDRDLLLFSGTDAMRNVAAAKRFVTEIMPLVHREAPCMRFLWVGNVDRTKLSFLDQDWIDTTGFVQHTPPHIDRGMIFVSPFNMGEGMKTKIVEAMAMGKVIVTTRIGASGVDTDGLPFVRVAQTNEEFAQAVLEFRRNPDIWELGMQARQYAREHYDWRLVLDPLNGFLSRCLGDESTNLPAATDSACHDRTRNSESEFLALP